PSTTTLSPSPTRRSSDLVSTADYKELREMELKSFSTFTAYLNGSTVNVTYQGQPRRYQGGYITWDFFRGLGVKPALGRDFTQAEDRKSTRLNSSHLGISY